jgi:very-short-patch-repair endonuclease
MSEKTQNFIEKSILIHGDHYDYSKVEYKKSSVKVLITCKSHGGFLQRPNDHLRKNGCPLCAGNNILKTTEQFIEESILIHGDKYDYSKVEYKGLKKEITIICKNHGEFKQTPGSHLRGSDCFKCAHEKRGNLSRKTTEQFIQEAIEKHGDKYDYSKVNYKTALNKVIIICKNHGEFKQVAISHLRGSGCPLCAGNNILKTKEQFINDAISIHGDKYDYSQVNYINTNTKVNIVCKKHSYEFEQMPSSHLQNQGCPKCGNRYSPTTNEFIKNAMKIHGDKYDYSKVNYIGNKKKIIIICKQHGEFLQKPNGHLCGMGCFKCAHEKIGNLFRKTQEEFIKEVILKHGDKYNYSKVNYNTTNDKIIIICNIHGEFEQTPNSHLHGQGCFMCGRISCGDKLIKSQDEFIKEANIKHDNKYDYSKVNYIGNKKKIIIICKQHGEFLQKPNGHLRGAGCPCCMNKTEGLFYKIMKEIYPSILYQYKQEWCKKTYYLPFDFCIEENKIIIELDGGQHFIQVMNWLPPEEQFKNDKYKEKCANDNGYSIIRLLQIDVFDDKYDWKTELINNIEKIKTDNIIQNIYMCKNNEYGDFIN